MFHNHDASYVKGALTGALAGAAIGAGLALLLAPRSGAETREGIRRFGHTAREKATDLGRRVKSSGAALAGRGADLIERGREVAAEAVDEGARAFKQATDAKAVPAVPFGSESAAASRGRHRDQA